MKQIYVNLFKNTKRIALFLIISGIFLLFYTPHLRFNIKLADVSDGTVIVSNFNTDRGEEIFTNYNYNSHKTWYDVHPGWEEVNITSIPIVTNSLRVELNDCAYLVADKITVSFGGFTLKEYTSSNLTEDISSSEGLAISLEDNQIHLESTAVKGWFQLETFEYLPTYIWWLIHIGILVISWLIAYIIDRHIDFVEKIQDSEIMLLAIPCWIFFICECIIGNYYYIDLMHRLLNVGILIIIYKLIYLILRRKPCSVLIVNLVVVGFSIASVFVIQFRSRPIAPWDFSALGTALDVASNYRWSFPYFMFGGILLAFIFWIIMRHIPKETNKLNKYYAAYLIIIIAIAVFFTNTGSYYLWDMNLLSTYQTDGTALSFTGLFAQYMNEQPKKPEGYSTEELEALKEEYETKATESTGEGIVPDTIIQIMNESFSDLNIGGTDIAGDVTPFFNSLDNTIRGNLYVSVRGGGTCNTEYETLTGNTTAFFASGVYPYNMYMSREVPSIISYFNESGYTTTGIHLGKSTNWNRASAYKKLDFQNTEFAETFDGLETLHGYPSDAEDFKHVIQQFEANQDGKNYIFNVTYQNHGGYDNAPDLTKTVDLSQAGTGDYTHAENYLSLLKQTDEDFKNFIEYFKNVDQHVLIVMYGDHQPSLGADCDNLFFPNAANNSYDALSEYITPFVIWANYDIPDEQISMMSTNYMSSLILKTANLTMTPYQQFLSDLREEYPVIGPFGCIDKDGKYYESIKDIEDVELINQYQALQYNNVFDKNRNTELFWPES